LEKERFEMKQNLGNARRHRMLDVVIMFLALLLANSRATMFVYLYPDTSALLGPAWIEIFLWMLVLVSVLYILKREGLVADYLSAWRKNWLLSVFVALALLSVFWSAGFSVTLFRALEFFFATLIGAYIGVRYRPGDLMGIVFWFGAIMLILSSAIAYAVPRTGVMYWAPFYGAWRGIYWHRNHLGSITALVNAVLFCRVIIAVESRYRDGVLDGIFYVFSLLVLYFTKSATGYILFIVMHFCVICYWLWIKVAHRLQKQHYYMIFGSLLLGGILILSNLDFVFGLFNRNSTLTGRVGLWSYLLQEVVPQRLWWGYGFGAFWTLDSFRELVRQNIGWASQPLIGDNGFLDILLHVGVMGLLTFLGGIVLALVWTLKHAISHKSLADFVPLLVMIYALFANISFSMFAETEVFVWLLIAASLFMTTPVLSSGKAT
jgi:O-antigen ligase